ncbi:helix-hairpin-helix domain-containing protein [Ornithinibacillus sp. 179-J 7C1 HS]|uniref:helix-hairpin-helix domain-containing protein n=1 Tax=Ornithinibacillus sp. 179-J 7C1 HS TaxID=3142384 RepID=UPI0039A10221
MLEMIRKNRFILFIVMGVVIVFIIYIKRADHQEVITPFDDGKNLAGVENLEENEAISAVVDIKGEVIRPGVYEMEPNARVKDVIDIAGGFTEDADQNYINLAQKVIDEMVILVPRIGEEGGTTEDSPENSKIRINYATEEEIQKLPGIGPSKAKAIVQYREEHGYFQSIEDLLGVSGIGEKTLEGIQEEIQVP